MLSVLLEAGGAPLLVVPDDDGETPLRIAVRRVRAASTRDMDLVYALLKAEPAAAASHHFLPHIASPV